MKSIEENSKDQVNAWDQATLERLKAGFEKCSATEITYTPLMPVHRYWQTLTNWIWCGGTCSACH